MGRILAGIRSVGYGALGRGRNLSWSLILVTLPMMATAEPVTIAALGDSLTQGYGLVPERGFVPALEAWLQSRGEDVLLINAGVSGDTTAGGLSRIEWTLTDEVDALIVALGGNDVLRGLPPEAAAANLEGILSVAETRGLPVLLVGISAPGNYGPDYKREFEAIYPDLAARFGTLLYPDFLKAIAEEGTETALADLMQPDGIHPNARGVRMIVDDIGDDVQALIGLATEN